MQAISYAGKCCKHWNNLFILGKISKLSEPTNVEISWVQWGSHNITASFKAACFADWEAFNLKPTLSKVASSLVCLPLCEYSFRDAHPPALALLMLNLSEIRFLLCAVRYTELKGISEKVAPNDLPKVTLWICETGAENRNNNPQVCFFFSWSHQFGKAHNILYQQDIIKGLLGYSRGLRISDLSLKKKIHVYLFPH